MQDHKKHFVFTLFGPVCDFQEDTAEPIFRFSR